MCPEWHLFLLFLGNIKSKGLFQWMDTGIQMSPQIVPSDIISAMGTGEFTEVLVQATNFFSPKRPHVGIYCIYNFSRSWWREHKAFQ